MGSWSKKWDTLLTKWYLIPLLVALTVGGILICMYAHPVVLVGMLLVLGSLYGILKPEEVNTKGKEVKNESKTS